MEKEEEPKLEEVRFVKSKVNPPSYYCGGQASTYEEGIQPRERYFRSEYDGNSYQEEIPCQDRPNPYTREPQPPPTPSPPSQEALLTLMADLVKRSSDDMKAFVTKEIGSLKAEKDEIKDQVKAMAITLKSGKTLDPPYVPKIPFPQRVKKSKLDKQDEYYDKQVELLKSISCRIDTLESERERLATQPIYNRMETCCAIFNGANASFDNALYDYDDDALEEPTMSYEDAQETPPVSQQNESSMNSLIMETLQSATQKLKKLEKRVDEIFIKQEQKIGSSLQDQEINEVSLRSGKNYGPPPPKTRVQEPQVWVEVLNDHFNVEEDIVAPKNDIFEMSTIMPPPNPPLKEPPPYIPKLPFPHGAPKRLNVDKELDMFMDMLKKLYPTMPFLELVDKGPIYKSFIKELLADKSSKKGVNVCSLNYACSALISSSIPRKREDPGQFTIPCSIGKVNFSRPLADLGASMSIMPLSVYQRLNLGDLKSSNVVVFLADGSSRKAKGELKNCPVKIDEFYVPCDFVVMDMGGHRRDSLILGRPFLATTKTKINVEEGKLKMKICGETLKFKNPKRISLSEANAIEKKKPPTSPKLTKKKLAKLQDDEDDPFLMWLASQGESDDDDQLSQTPTLQMEHSSNKETRARGCNSSKDPG